MHASLPEVLRGWTFYSANSLTFSIQKSQILQPQRKGLYLLGGRHLRKSCLPSYSHLCPSSGFALTPLRAS